MTLYVTAKSPVQDLVIDFIEVRLRSGETVSLNWAASYVDRFGEQIRARYIGVCFNEDPAAGRLNELEGMQVESVGMYSDEHGEGEFPLTLEDMDFYDEGGNSLYFENAYSFVPSALKPETVGEKMYRTFLASSWR